MHAVEPADECWYGCPSELRMRFYCIDCTESVLFACFCPSAERRFRSNKYQFASLRHRSTRCHIINSLTNDWRFVWSGFMFMAARPTIVLMISYCRCTRTSYTHTLSHRWIKYSQWFFKFQFRRTNSIEFMYSLISSGRIECKFMCFKMNDNWDFTAHNASI